MTRFIIPKHYISWNKLHHYLQQQSNCFYHKSSYRLIEERFEPDAFRYVGIYYYQPSTFRWISSLMMTPSTFSDYFYFKIEIEKQTEEEDSHSECLVFRIESHKIPSFYLIRMIGKIHEENTKDSRCEFEIQRFDIDTPSNFIVKKIKDQVIRILEKEIRDIIHCLL